MIHYGFLTSSKQRALHLYRIDKFYQATFGVVLIFLLTQIIAGITGVALIYWDGETAPQARENELRERSLATREAKDQALVRKMETAVSLKSFITNRIPASGLIRNIEEAFFQNDGVCLTDLKLSNGFDFSNLNAKDAFTIILTGAIKPGDRTPTQILSDLTKSLINELPKGSKVDVLRNAATQRTGEFVTFDVKIHFSLEK
jgi:hypothetical protein